MTSIDETVRQAELVFRKHRNLRNIEWLIGLIDHPSIEHLQTDERPGKRRDIAAYFARFIHGRHLGNIHVCSSRDEPLDIIHETVHAASQAVRTINHLALNFKTEERLAGHLENMLLQILDFYGYEVRRKGSPQ